MYTLLLYTPHNTNGCMLKYIIKTYTFEVGERLVCTTNNDKTLIINKNNWLYCIEEI